MLIVIWSSDFLAFVIVMTQQTVIVTGLPDLPQSAFVMLPQVLIVMSMFDCLQWFGYC